MAAVVEQECSGAWTVRSPGGGIEPGHATMAENLPDPGRGTSVEAVASPLGPAERALGFEAAMMMRCTVPISARRRMDSPLRLFGPSASGVLSEFNQAAAAYRLARLLDALGIDVRVEQNLNGGWHRYQVYRVVVSPGDGGQLQSILDSAWRSGHLLLCRSVDRLLTRWQQRDRRALATAAWRAALLAAGRRRGGTLALRLADPDTTSVLVNGARFLGVQIRAQSRPGYHLLSVRPGTQSEQLFAVVGGAESLEPAV